MNDYGVKRIEGKVKLTGHEIGESYDAYDEDDDPFLSFLDEVSHSHLVRLRRHVHLKIHRIAAQFGKAKTQFKSISVSLERKFG